MRFAHQRRFNAIIPRLIILLPVLLIIFASSAQEATPEPVPAVSPAEVLAEAERTADKAANAVETVSLILNFFQVAGLVAATLVGIAALAGVRTINEYRADLREARERVDEMLTDFEQRINTRLNEVEQVSQSMAAYRAGIEAEVDEVRTRGDNAIRALTLVQLGEQQMHDRNWRAAQRTFEEAFALDPANRAVNYFLGELYLMKRDLEKGEQRLRAAQASGEIYPPAEAALAYALRLQGDLQENLDERNRYYAQAERRFLEAVRADHYARDINGESVYGMLARLYWRQGRIEDALRCYHEAETITPHSSFAPTELGLLHYAQGDERTAREYFQRAIDLARQRLEGSPTNYWARYNLSVSLAATGDTNQALRELDLLLATPHSTGPLQSFLGGFRTLYTCPNPPRDADRMVERVMRAIQYAGNSQPT
jgi:tetratricopeptide (TPR) repeat protein